jgi:hypothetical protein
MVNRRGFIRSALAGLALTIAAPVLARRAALSGRCEVYPVLILGKDRLRQEWREVTPLRGSVIRFRRDPSLVFEL